MNNNRNQLRIQLFNAIEQGNVNTIKYLLNNNRININRSDPWNRTPLRRAIAMGHVNVVRLLIQKGARVNRNNLGFIAQYMNTNTEKNRTLKNIITHALGRQARARAMTARVREGLRLRRIYHEGLNTIRKKYPKK
jgi:ankyrin repeat protein